MGVGVLARYFFPPLPTCACMRHFLAAVPRYPSDGGIMLHGISFGCASFERPEPPVLGASSPVALSWGGRLVPDFAQATLYPSLPSLDPDSGMLWHRCCVYTPRDSHIPNLRT